MKFNLIQRTVGEEREVSEDYDKDTDDPEKWCRDIIDWFNSTLRPGQRPREFIRVELVESEDEAEKS